MRRRAAQLAGLCTSIAVCGLVARGIWNLGLNIQVPSRTGLGLRGPASSGGAGAVVVDDLLADSTNGYETVERNSLDPVILQSVGLVWICACGCLQLCYGFYHYFRCIVPTQHQFIPRDAVISPDLQGGWKFGLFDCFSDLKACCGFCWCQPCFMAELWFRAGHIHQQTDIPANNPGQAWLYGLIVQALATYIGLGECMVFLYTVFRGGVPGSDPPTLIPLRKRFYMPHDGWSTFCGDCCTWCCCPVCAGTQEYRQVMELLRRGPVQQHPPTMAVMQMSTVQVQGYTSQGYTSQLAQPGQSYQESAQPLYAPPNGYPQQGQPAYQQQGQYPQAPYQQQGQYPQVPAGQLPFVQATAMG